MSKYVCSPMLQRITVKYDNCSTLMCVYIFGVCMVIAILMFSN